MTIANNIPALDLDAPFLRPATILLAFVRQHGEIVDKRLLAHKVGLTIGAPTTPARGKGSSALYSCKDLALMLAGNDIHKLSVPPDHVRICVNTMRDGWNDIFETPFVESLKSWRHRQFGTDAVKIEAPEVFKYLVAVSTAQRTLAASIVSQGEFLRRLQTSFGSASIVYNATFNLSVYLVAAMAYADGQYLGEKHPDHPLVKELVGNVSKDTKQLYREIARECKDL